MTTAKTTLEQLRESTLDDLHTKVDELKRELFQKRFDAATNKLTSTADFGRIKHQIAQIKTVITQKKNVG